MAAILAHCPVCFDTSPHCECRDKGNKYWAEGFYQYALINPRDCRCHLCKQRHALHRRGRHSNLASKNVRKANGGPLDRWLAVLEGLELDNLVPESQSTPIGTHISEVIPTKAVSNQ